MEEKLFFELSQIIKKEKGPSQRFLCRETFQKRKGEDC